MFIIQKEKKGIEKAFTHKDIKVWGKKKNKKYIIEPSEIIYKVINYVHSHKSKFDVSSILSKVSTF